jgi:hypothetical protein
MYLVNLNSEYLGSSAHHYRLYSNEDGNVGIWLSALHIHAKNDYRIKPSCTRRPPPEYISLMAQLHPTQQRDPFEDIFNFERNATLKEMLSVACNSLSVGRIDTTAQARAQLAQHVRPLPEIEDPENMQNLVVSMNRARVLNEEKTKRRMQRRQRGR